jgi:hypothetical protein
MAMGGDKIVQEIEKVTEVHGAVSTELLSCVST